MKRFLCLFLSFALLISFAPMVLAVHAEQPEQPEQAALPTAEEHPFRIHADPPDGIYETLPTETRQILSALPDAVSGTVGVSVELPAGCTLDNAVNTVVELYTAPETDAGGRIITSSESVYGLRPDGSASVTFPYVEPGRYVVAVSNSSMVDGLCCGEFFYNADGTQAAGLYSAVPVTVTSGRIVNVSLALPAAEHTVSGRLVFTEAPEKDTSFWMYFDSAEGNGESYVSVNLRVSAGETELPYCIGLPEDVYTMSVSANTYGTADIDGNLSTDYERRLYLNLYDGSVTMPDLSVTPKSSTAPAETVNVAVSFSIPASEEDRELLVFAFSSLGSIDVFKWFALAAGETDVAVTLQLNKDTSYGFGYQILPDIPSYYVTATRTPSYFFSLPSYGVTSVQQYSNPYPITESCTIEPGENDYYVLSGTVDRSALDDRRRALYYVMAESPAGELLGETFGVPVLFEPGETTATYEMLIPVQRENTAFTFYVHPTDSYLMNRYSTNVVSGLQEITVTGDASLPTLALIPPQHSISGTFTIPGGAPAGGLPVTLTAYSYASSSTTELATWIIPAGAEQFSYTIPSDLTGELILELQFPEIRSFLYRSLYGMNPGSDGCYRNADFTLTPTVSLSGRITMPDELIGSGATFSIYGDATDSADYLSCDSFASVIPGQSSASWQMQVPVGYTLEFLELTVRAGSPDLYTGSIYSDGHGGTSQEYVDLAVPITGPLSGYDFRLLRGFSIPVHITLADGLASGRYNGTIAAGMPGEKPTETAFSFTGAECTTAVSVPAEGSYAVGLYLYNSTAYNLGALTGMDLWYTSGGFVADIEDADLILTSAAVPVELVIPKAEVITVTIQVPDAAPADSFRGTIEFYQNGSYMTGKTFSFTGSQFTGTFPVRPGESYQVGYFLSSFSSSSGVLYNLRTDLFLRADGSMTPDPALADYFTAQDTIVLTMQKCALLSGTVTFAEEAHYAGSLYLGWDSSSQQDFDFTGDTLSYSVPAPSESVPLYIYLSDTDSMLYERYGRYYCRSDGTAVNANTYEDEFFITEDTVLDITVAPGRIVTGTLVSEDGSPLLLPEDGYVWAYLSDDYGNYYSFRGELFKDGSWRFLLGSDISAGDIYLSLDFSEAFRSNILDSFSYYYTDSASAATSKSEATPITIPESGDLTGLTVPVRTGWRISGTLLLPENAEFPAFDAGEIRSIWMGVQNTGSYGYWDSWAYWAGGDQSAEYSIVVEKSDEPRDLTVSRSSTNVFDDLDTNVCFDSLDEITLTGVDGDRTGVDFVLPLIKSTVSGLITVPECVAEEDYVSITVYLQTDTDETYNGYAERISDFLYSYAIHIPDSEPASAFRLSYYAYADGLSPNGYLTADGSVSVWRDDSADFPLTASVGKSFTLAEMPPYLSGKVYVPAAADKTFTVQIWGYDTSVMATFDPNSCLTDEEGRRYIPYSFTSNDGYDSYSPSVTVTADQNGLLKSGTFFLSASGETVENSYESTYLYADQPNIWNIELPLEESIFESGHGLRPGEYTYTYHLPGTSTYTWVELSDYTDVAVSINGTPCTETFYTSDETDTLTFTFTVTEAGAFGFRVTELDTYLSVTPEITTAAAVYTENGSDAATVLNDVQNGLPLRVCLISDSDASEYTPEVRTVLVASYDENGRFLGLTTQEITFTEPCAAKTAEMTLENVEDAASLSVFLADDSFCPNMAAIKLS